MARRLSPIAAVVTVAQAPEQTISPLEGEMPGRAEGGPYAHIRYFFFAFAGAAFFGLVATAFAAAFDTFAFAPLPSCFT